MKDESYTPEEIFQAGFIVMQKHGKIFLDELIMELKRMYPKKPTPVEEGE